MSHTHTHTDIDNIEKTYKNQNMSHTPLIYENTQIENDEINRRIEAIIQTKNAACVVTSEVTSVNIRDSTVSIGDSRTYLVKTDCTNKDSSIGCSIGIDNIGVDNIGCIEKTPQNFKPYEYEEEENLYWRGS